MAVSVGVRSARAQWSQARRDCVRRWQRAARLPGCRSPRRARSSVRVRAGSSRRTVPCVQLISSRRSRHASTTAAPSTVSSRPIIAPLTRTSWISGQRCRSASKRWRNRSPIASAALEQAVLLDRLDRGQGGAAGERVAAEGGRVRARLQLLGDLRPGDQAAAATPPASALASVTTSGCDVPVLIGEPVAGPAHAGLHFVEDQQQLVLVGQLAQPFR